MKQLFSRSKEQTRRFAQNFAKRLGQTHHEHNVIALYGELGAGKTTFTQGFAKGLGIKEKIISPTFVLIRQHKIPQTDKTLYHIDLYRLGERDRFKDLGLEEIISNPNNLVLIEWAEKLKNLPKDTTKILIQKKENNKRIITLS